MLRCLRTSSRLLKLTSLAIVSGSLETRPALFILEQLESFKAVLKIGSHILQKIIYQNKNIFFI